MPTILPFPLNAVVNPSPSCIPACLNEQELLVASILDGLSAQRKEQKSALKRRLSGEDDASTQLKGQKTVHEGGLSGNIEI